ncbi:hypothetical protein [Rufibacter sp. LB8]|uniref:hypothetical protein n=1 Tax=Rufibacter sp. LB8 TaxID=2777781 RepID=UPI00178C5D60|nr:hypothetical protein [Rufibacter sp. LB8]
MFVSQKYLGVKILEEFRMPAIASGESGKAAEVLALKCKYFLKHLSDLPQSAVVQAKSAEWHVDIFLKEAFNYTHTAKPDLHTYLMSLYNASQSFSDFLHTLGVNAITQDNF